MERMAIIGSGPAGLYAALEGVSSGFAVTLFEQKKIGENINCAEGFFDTLKILGKPKKGVRFKVKNIIVRLNREHKIKCDNFNLWMIDRAEWQKYLGEKAAESGVKIKENHKIKPQDLDDLRKSYKWVVDASGVYSVTSKAYDFKRFYKENSAVAFQYVLEGDFSHIGENLKVGIEPDYLGYYWIFPKGMNREGIETANVGIGIYETPYKINIKQKLERVLKKEGLEEYNIIDKRGGLLPVKYPEKLIYDNIILAGDAAGLVSPLHGGGIDLACISGRIAAQEAARGGKDYKKRLFKIIGRKLQMEKDLSLLWAKLDHSTFEELLEIVLCGTKISPLLLWKYRGLMGKELTALKVFLRGAIKVDWQGKYEDEKMSFFEE